MAIGSGLAAQLMLKEEGTYNSAVTPDRTYEFNSESISHDLVKLTSAGLGRGPVARTDRVKTYTRNHGGDIEFDFLTKNMGLLMKLALGSAAVTGAGADKTHTFVQSATVQQGNFATVQVGRPDVGGTVRPFTYAGGKILTWEIMCDLDGIVKLKTNWNFASVLTATSLASPSYVATQEPFIFNEGAITIAAAAVSAKSFSIKGDGKLATDRRFIGGAQKEPIAGDFTDFSGSIGMEFNDLTEWGAAIAGTQQALVATFTSPTIIPTTANPFKLTVTLPAVEFLEAKPNVGGPGLVPLTLPFRVLENGAAEPITVAIVTSDTAA